MNIQTFVRRHPIGCYLAMAYTISWAGAAVVAVPKLLQGQTLQSFDGLLMFPAMLAGPPLAGITLTGIIDGKPGLRELLSRLMRWNVGGQWRWYFMLLVPPVLIASVLFALSTFASPVFAPRLFPLGILFGLFAGLLEEIGWTGYALPRMVSKETTVITTTFRLSILGVLWGLWHLPVIDFLGAASPHGAYWLPYAFAFIAVMSAIRVLLGWTYLNTRSILLAQLLHASSTGFLVMLSPSSVSPAQEALWYGVYAAVLWICIAGSIAIMSVVVARRLSPVREPTQSRAV